MRTIEEILVIFTPVQNSTDTFPVGYSSRMEGQEMTPEEWEIFRDYFERE